MLAIIPAFNEGACIGEVLSKIPDWVDVVVVNDGSSDNTKEVSYLYDAVVLNHEENKGYQEALITGVAYFMASSYTQFVVIDADGEIEVASATAMLREVNEEQPIFCGFRTKYKGRIAERIVGKISNQFFGIKDLYCGCKSLHRSILVELAPEQICAGTFTYFVLKKSFDSKIVNFPVGGTARKGKSKFGTGVRVNLRLLGRFLLNLVILITEFKKKQKKYIE